MAVHIKLVLVLNIVIIVNVVNSFKPKIDPLVRIEQGLVRGQQSEDGSYEYFLGIPYAQVEMNNPFGKSMPPPSFGNEIYNAYDGSTVCPQTVIIGNSKQSLDCLRLNIHVPHKATSKTPLPVLVWMHGEEFDGYQDNAFDPKHIMEQDVVVVTINYRLGPYGFLCLDTPNVPGNQGLKDQYEALRWIRNNIAAFGGNPYEVTISGSRTGACSTLLHLFSSKDKLYKRIIAESGTPFSNGMFVEADIQAAIKLATHLNFNTTNTEEALEFLTRSDPDLVIGAFDELSLNLRPCKEYSFSGIENFVESYPHTLTNEKKVKNTPVLIGYASTEGEEIIHFYGDDYFKSDPFTKRLHEVFDLSEEQFKETTNILKHFYIGDEAVSEDLTAELANFELDFTLAHPIERTIIHLLKEKATPIYQYLFNYNSTSRLSMEDPDNQIMIQRITTLWANFVKYGNPTPKITDMLPVIWKPVTEEIRPCMVIDKNLNIRSRIYHNRMAFWDLFFDKYEKNQKLRRECTINNRYRVETPFENSLLH